MADILRTVLFVDFDNVFFALQSADRDAARAFAVDPQGWLEAIESGALIEEAHPEAAPVRRRILMRRCYANPAVMRYFRGGFTRSGFQIVDCPPLTGKGKNSADIYMVVDMLDALRHETRFDEFVILSGDADFTPVLTRLRAHDRRSIIYSNAVTASAYKSLCDAMITEERLIDMAVGGLDEEPADFTGASAVPAPPAERRPPARADTGAATDGDGAGTDGEAVAESRPAPERPRPDRANGGRPDGVRPEASRSEGRERRARPELARFADQAAVGDAGTSRTAADTIELIARRISSATNVPLFAPEVYASLFRALAAEIGENGFSLNRTINGVMRRLGEVGLKPRPQAVAFVVKGLMLSGHELLPADTPATLARAFARQVLYLAANADLVLADEERRLVGAWIIGALRSAGPDAPAEPPADDPHRAAAVAGVAIEQTLHAVPADPPDGGDGEDAGYGPPPDDGEAADETTDDDEEAEERGSADPGAEHGEDESLRSRRKLRDIDDLLARMRRPSRD